MPSIKSTTTSLLLKLLTILPLLASSTLAQTAPVSFQDTGNLGITFTAELIPAEEGAPPSIPQISIRVPGTREDGTLISWVALGFGAEMDGSPIHMAFPGPGGNSIILSNRLATGRSLSGHNPTVASLVPELSGVDPADNSWTVTLRRTTLEDVVARSGGSAEMDLIWAAGVGPGTWLETDDVNLVPEGNHGPNRGTVKVALFGQLGGTGQGGAASEAAPGAAASTMATTSAVRATSTTPPTGPVFVTTTATTRTSSATGRYWTVSKSLAGWMTLLTSLG
ncbi:hypothetical protein HDV05_006077, partial [Chytridiales sp. JEL 0842]